MTDPIQLARECGFTPVNYSLETPPEADDVFIATHEQLVLLISRARAEAMEDVEKRMLYEIKAMRALGFREIQADGVESILPAIRALMQEEGR